MENGKPKRILVANRDSHSITVMDAATQDIETTYHVNHHPDGMAMAPDGKTLFVANSGDLDRGTPYGNTVSVLDLEKKRVISTIQVGVFPRRIAITPDGQNAYVTNYYSNTVSVIDTANHTIVSTIQLSDYPFGISISADGQFAFIVLVASRNLVILNLQSHTLHAIIPIEKFDVEEITTTEDGKLAFLSCPKSSVIVVLDLQTRTVRTTFAVGLGFMGMVCAKQTARLFVSSSGDHSVHVFDYLENRKIDSISVGLLPRSLAMSPDEEQIYVINQADHSLSVINMGSSNTCSTILFPDGISPRYVVLA